MPQTHTQSVAVPVQCLAFVAPSLGFALALGLGALEFGSAASNF